MSDFDIGSYDTLAVESREVYEDPDRPDVVLKRETRGSQNAAEARAWREAPETLRAWLAPVLEHRGDWLVMERASPYPTMAQMGRLHDGLTRAGYGVVDFRDDNAGVLRGRPVLIDYESVFRLDDAPAWKREEWERKRSLYP